MMILLIVVGIWLLLRVADWREGKPFIPKRRQPKGMGWFGFVVCLVLLFGGFIVAGHN